MDDTSQRETGRLVMSKQWKNGRAGLAAMVFGALVGFGGCESKGPAEKAGEAIDKGIQDAKDAVNPPGPAEKAGRNLDKALEP
jgi:hypothetical protein